MGPDQEGLQGEMSLGACHEQEMMELAYVFLNPSKSDRPKKVDENPYGVRLLNAL